MGVCKSRACTLFIYRLVDKSIFSIPCVSVSVGVRIAAEYNDRFPENFVEVISNENETLFNNFDETFLN